jgi:hypothetical protein
MVLSRSASRWPFTGRIAKLSMRSSRTSGPGWARSPKSRSTTGSSAGRAVVYSNLAEVKQRLGALSKAAR